MGSKMAILGYIVHATAAGLAAQRDAIWKAYYEDQLAQRGLPPGSSLDTQNGQPIPPITTQWAEVVEAPGFAGGAIIVDEVVDALHGRVINLGGRGNVTINARTARVARGALPVLLRNRAQAGAPR